jgi:hypothetical protein
LSIDQGAMWIRVVAATTRDIMAFTLAQFEPLVGAAFDVRTSHGALALTLAEARTYPRRGLPDHLPTPLSLIFDGPPGVVLAHDDYLVAHPAIGQAVLNIVPVMPGGGAPAGRPQYQILIA